MTVNPTVMPAMIVPMAFLFVLLIILVSKSPKVGAWLVGGLVLMLPVFLFRVLGLGIGPAGLPMIIVPATFLFVLLIVLTAKAPKAGAVLIVALVVIMLGLFSMFLGTHRMSEPTKVVYQSLPPAPLVPQPVIPQPSPTPEQRAEMSKGSDDAWAQVSQLTPEQRAVIATHGEDVKAKYDGTHVPLSVRSATPAPASSEPLSPIWSFGVDQELDADVYPSVFAATRAASAKLGRSIRELAADANALPKVTVFQQDHPYRLIAELRDAIRRALPEVSCDVESEYRPPRAGELIVTLSQRQLTARSAPWIEQAHANPGAAELRVGASSTVWLASGQVDIQLSGRGGMTIPLHFTDKPWIEDFATFASTRPEQAFIIVRSQGACTSEAEANQQALNDACARLQEAMGKSRRWEPAALPQPQVTPTDVLQGGFIVDRFAQSLEASAARVWRQALLLDVSGPKLAKLAHQKAGEFRQVRQSWAWMGLSTIGVLVLIGVIYFFLNMATMGYYEWSLRIACVVLAVVGVLSILMVVK